MKFQRNVKSLSDKRPPRALIMVLDIDSIHNMRDSTNKLTGKDLQATIQSQKQIVYIHHRLFLVETWVAFGERDVTSAMEAIWSIEPTLRFLPNHHKQWRRSRSGHIKKLLITSIIINCMYCTCTHVMNFNDELRLRSP